jgi:hypothetical protein
LGSWKEDKLHAVAVGSHSSGYKSQLTSLTPILWCLSWLVSSREALGVMWLSDLSCFQWAVCRYAPEDTKFIKKVFQKMGYEMKLCIGSCIHVKARYIAAWF